MSASAAARARAAPVISLFRSILRLHRDKLPPPMRAMGDAYVKDEFSKHLRGKTTERQWQVFMQEWQRYHAMLSGNADILADPAAAAAARQARASSGSSSSSGGGQGMGAQGPAADLSAAAAGSAAGSAAAQTTVSAAASGSCGELADDVLGMLTPDQRARLDRLRQEAGRFGRDLLKPGEGGAVGAVAGDNRHK
ncbi:hypothetical protein N2152v2_000924 [Parachlorella kessleri]